MGYVPGCRFDLFISYASENNRDGWVEQFEKALGQELGDLLGRHFGPRESIFFDKRELEVAQSFPQELINASRDSAILVPVLSPSYLTSPWCQRERTEFFSQLPHGAEPAGCLSPVVVRPIEEDGLDALYRNAQRASFLCSDGQMPLPAGSPEWTTRLQKFAAQLKNALQRLRSNCKPVFLGKTAETDRAQKLRSWCRTELERRHFRTVPESLPALEDPDGVRSSLQEAGLAIHFLGGATPAALDAIETSIVVCTGPTILYQPFGTELILDEQMWLEDFEHQLQAAPGRYQRLAGKNDQELLALIDEQITQGHSEAEAGNSEVELALVCEEADLESVRQFKGDLKIKHPMEVESPDFVGCRLRAMERLRKWHDYLSHGDTLLFYYGLAERNRLDLIWQTARQQRPNARSSWFLAPPDLERKRQQFPDALWNLDQVVHFLERSQGASA